MSELFDEIAKTLAKPTTRRRMLGTVAGLVGGAAIAAIRPGRARAAGTCTAGSCPPPEFCCQGTFLFPGVCCAANQGCDTTDQFNPKCVSSCAPTTTSCVVNGIEQCCTDVQVCDPAHGCVCPSGTSACGSECCGADEVCDPTMGCVLPSGKKCKDGKSACTGGGKTKCCKKDEACCVFSDKGKTKLKCCKKGETCDPARGCVKA